MYHLFVNLLLREVKDGLGGAWAFVLRDIIYTLIHHINNRLLHPNTHREHAHVQYHTYTSHQTSLCLSDPQAASVWWGFHQKPRSVLRPVDLCVSGGSAVLRRCPRLPPTGHRWDSYGSGDEPARHLTAGKWQGSQFMNVLQAQYEWIVNYGKWRRIVYSRSHALCKTAAEVCLTKVCYDVEKALTSFIIIVHLVFKQTFFKYVNILQFLHPERKTKHLLWNHCRILDFCIQIQGWTGCYLFSNLFNKTVNSVRYL